MLVSPHLHTVRDVARTGPFGSFFLDPSVIWAPTVRTLSETSKDHALCCMLNHGNTLVQLLHCLSLSSCQLESTLPPAEQLILQQSQQGYLVGYHLRLSNVLERVSQSSCELFARQTLPNINRIHLFTNIICIVSFCPQKTRGRCCSVAILTSETNLRT
jgi:hypothetical protein